MADSNPTDVAPAPRRRDVELLDTSVTRQAARHKLMSLENYMWKKFRAESWKRCDDPVSVFAECQRGRTLSVAWACREQREKMYQCLARATNEESWAVYRREYLLANGEKHGVRYVEQA